MMSRRRPTTPGEGFVPLPAPAGAPPYRRRLADVLDPDRVAAIDRDGVVRFHCVGTPAAGAMTGPSAAWPSRRSTS
jgi:hypothetical protein